MGATNSLNQKKRRDIIQIEKNLVKMQHQYRHAVLFVKTSRFEGRDWRLLAERLNVHRYVTFFETRPSPTEAILHLWEARNREIIAVSYLTNILRGMGRFDAAAVIELQIIESQGIEAKSSENTAVHL